MRIAYKENLFPGIRIVEGRVDKLKSYEASTGRRFRFHPYNSAPKEDLRLVDPATEKELNQIDADVQDLQEQINALNLHRRKLLEKRFRRFKAVGDTVEITE